MEKWLPVPDYVSLYEVSNAGNVRSVVRQITQISKKGVPYTRTMKSKPIVGFTGSSGRYRFVHLANVGYKTFSVHALVLRAFVGEKSGRIFNHRRYLCGLGKQFISTTAAFFTAANTLRALIQIQLKQLEIEKALKAYITSLGIDLAGKTVTIAFTSGRKDNGLSADIEFEDAGNIPGYTDAPAVRVVPTPSQQPQAQAQAQAFKPAAVPANVPNTPEVPPEPEAQEAPLAKVSLFTL